MSGCQPFSHREFSYGFYQHPDDSRDRPLRLDYQLSQELRERLGIRSSRDNHVDIVTGSMLAQALIGYREGRACSVSLNRNFYTDLGRYHPALRYLAVRAALTLLEGSDLLEIEKGLTWPKGRGRQTRFRANPSLVDLAGAAPLLHRQKLHEPIVLKDSDKNLMAYRNTEQTDRWRRQVREHNEVIGSADIRIAAPDIDWNEDGYVTVPDAMKLSSGGRGPMTFRVDADVLKRSFNNGSWREGGRLYGHWAQNLPKERRRQITIDAAPVELLDYGASHISILYAQAGIPLDGDPYDITGFKRDEIKLGLLIAINASTEKGAVRALGKKLAEAETPPSVYAERRHLARARQVLEAITTRHAAIEEWFWTGAGLRLQFEEAEVIAGVMKATRRKGIVCLPVHDEIIVSRGRSASLVQDFMIEEWSNRFGTFPVVSQ